LQLLSARFVALTLSTAFFVSGSIFAAPTPEAVGGAEFVKNLTALISSEYIYKTPAEKLFDGAVQGLNTAMKQKKVPLVKLDKIHAKGDFEKAAKEFYSGFLQGRRQAPQAPSG
jgi:hypothetical protein